jgi:hypothetical protein
VTRFALGIIPTLGFVVAGTTTITGAIVPTVTVLSIAVSVTFTQAFPLAVAVTFALTSFA